MKKLFPSLLAIILFSSCKNESKTEAIPVNYPQTAKVDTIDTYFGTEVKDPYRWLEDDRSKETEAWVKDQNKTTFGYLENIPFRNDLKKRLEQLWNYEKLGSPRKRGDYTYFYKNDGLQNQYVVYRTKDDDAEPEVFLDPNTFSEDGTTSLAGLTFTKDGSLATYLISEGGSDWRKAIVMDTDTKEIKEDTLVDIKFSGVSWKGNDGFYYSSYDKPKGSELSAKTDQHKVPMNLFTVVFPLKNTDM
jgi:prolyl oligopeptidase